MVSLESYTCLCSESEGLALMSTRSGKQYIKCKNSGCGYFTNTEQFGQYNDILAEQVNIEYKQIRQPLCSHLQPATLRVSKSEKNPGKGFFSCGQIESCGYFQWAEARPTRKTIQNWDLKDKPKMQDKATMTDDPIPPRQPVKRSSTKQGSCKEQVKKNKKYIIPEND